MRVNESTYDLSKRLGIPVMSDEEWKLKMAAEKRMLDKGWKKAEESDFASKIVFGVLLFVFVIGFMMLSRSFHPWNCYCRRYWYW